MSESLVRTEFINFEYDQIERSEKIIKLIEESRRSSSRSAWPVNFMNRDCDLEMIHVPISLPMYRLGNGRTLSLQDEYLAMNSDLPEDFFSMDENSPEVQSVQHELLMKLNESKDIIKTFRDTSIKQSEPIIITNTGFVVNGNRRLSCWRYLYYGDKVNYKHFEYIRVAVLPEADEKAIEKLEADLQIAPEIKEDYLWHAEARMMQRRIEERGEDIDDVAALYRVKRKDIEHRLEMLHYANEYLRRNNWDRQWSKLDKDLYAFEQFVKERKKIADPVEKSVFESLTFASITTGASGSGEGRIYAKIPEIRKHLIPIVEAIQDMLPTIVEPESPGEDIDLLLDGFEDTERDMTSIARTLVNLTVEEQKIIADEADRVIADENAKEKERKSTNYILTQVKKAAEAIENALNASDEDDIKTDGLSRYLDIIDERVALLRTWLSEHEDYC
jgi:hypothetical protein